MKGVIKDWQKELTLASQEGNLKRFQKAVAEGADIHEIQAGNRRGIATYLYISSLAAERKGSPYEGQVKIFKWLIEQNDFKWVIPGESISLPEALIHWGGPFDFVDKLMQQCPELLNPHDEKVILKAAKGAPLVSIQGLVERGWDIHSQNEEGQSVLSLLSMRWDASTIIQYVLNLGVDINHQDKNGMTPLLLAAKEGAFAAIKPLLEHGAQLHFKNQAGFTALQIIQAAAEADELHLDSWDTLLPWWIALEHAQKEKQMLNQLVNKSTDHQDDLNGLEERPGVPHTEVNGRKGGVVKKRSL